MKSNDKTHTKSSIPLNSIISVLQNPSKSKAGTEMGEIMEITHYIDFFSRINKELQNTDFHRICCSHMTVEEYAKGMPIYKIGDTNSAFYFILSGSVSIGMPTKLINILSIPREYVPLVRNIVKSASEKENLEALDILEQNIRKLFLDYIEQDLRIIEDLAVCKNRDISDTLTERECFNIVGLFTDRLRSHNAIAAEKTIVAVLSKSSFKKAVSAYNDKRVSDRIDFLHKLPLFSTWSRISLAKILEQFTSNTFYRNQKIFSEGDLADSVIFIMSGEVKLTKSQVTSKSLIEIGEFSSNPSSSSPLRLGKARKLVLTSQLQLVVKGKNQIIGIDDMGEDLKPRSYTCICHTSRADVLILNRKVFMERVSRPEIMPYINNKKSTENLWLNERVEEIKSIDRFIGSVTAVLEKPMKKKFKLRLGSPPVLLFRNKKHVEERACSSKPTSRIRKNSFDYRQKPETAPCSPKKMEVKRLPPPNFLMSYRKKRYSEHMQDTFLLTHVKNKSR